MLVKSFCHPVKTLATANNIKCLKHPIYQPPENSAKGNFAYEGISTKKCDHGYIEKHELRPLGDWIYEIYT